MDRKDLTLDDVNEWLMGLMRSDKFDIYYQYHDDEEENI